MIHPDDPDSDNEPDITATVTAARTRVRLSATHADHPIHLAAEAGHLERVRELLDADPTLVHRGDRAGGTALHRAVIGRAQRVVALLLDRGADIHAVHGAGLGSMAGYAPQDLQPIDIALWGGPGCPMAEGSTHTIWSGWAMTTRSCGA